MPILHVPPYLDSSIGAGAAGSGDSGTVVVGSVGSAGVGSSGVGAGAVGAVGAGAASSAQPPRIKPLINITAKITGYAFFTVYTPFSCNSQSLLGFDNKSHHSPPPFMAGSICFGKA
jgi:hypothetical protein